MSQIDQILKDMLVALPPEVQAELAKARESEEDSGAAILRVMTLFGQRPDVMMATTTALTRLGMQEQDGLPALVVPSPTGQGLPRLNPLYEAALKERLQFDGDIPEARFGPMPPDARPAVPVITDSKNPVEIGAQLRAASEGMAEQIRSIEARQVAQIEGRDKTALARTAAAEIDRATLPEPDGYRRGHRPTAVSVLAPAGVELLDLSQDEKVEMTWMFISTTQGRRSAIPLVRGIILDRLCEAGITANPTDTLNESYILSSAEWTINIHGTESAVPEFSIIDVAGEALAKKMIQAAQGQRSVLVWVREINDIADRRVGWTAFLTLEVAA